MADIVIVGGGFAGLWAALGAAHEVIGHGADTRVTLISKDQYLTIRPRLYEPRPQELRAPLAPSLDPVGVGFVAGTVTAIDPVARTVMTDHSTRRYDRLVLAAGSVRYDPPVPGLAEHGWDIDSYDAAITFDAHLATVAGLPAAPGRDTVVIVGAGFTGVELAAEMRDRLAVHVGEAAARRARIVLVEQADVIGPKLGAAPRPAIEAALTSLGIEFRLGAGLAAVDADNVRLTTGETIETRIVVTTIGFRASPLTALLPVARDELGRIVTDDALRASGVDDIFAAGDVARARVDDDHVALMSCQHAMPMGRVAGYNAARDLIGLPLIDYRQPRYVTCLDLGRAGALFTTGWDRAIELSGEKGKAMKRRINTEWIYPPTGNREDILGAADLDRDPGR